MAVIVRTGIFERPGPTVVRHHTAAALAGPPRMQSARYLFVEGGIFLDTDPRVYSCHVAAYLCTDLP